MERNRKKRDKRREEEKEKPTQVLDGICKFPLTIHRKETFKQILDI